MIYNCVLNYGKIPKDFPRVFWDRKDSGTVMYLHGGTGKSRGHSKVPRGLWDGKDSGTVMYLVGHGSPEDIP